jgi:hypothetical protein
MLSNLILAWGLVLYFCSSLYWQQLSPVPYVCEYLWPIPDIRNLSQIYNINTINIELRKKRLSSNLILWIQHYKHIEIIQLKVESTRSHKLCQSLLSWYLGRKYLYVSYFKYLFLQIILYKCIDDLIQA